MFSGQAKQYQSNNYSAIERKNLTNQDLIIKNQDLRKSSMTQVLQKYPRSNNGLFMIYQQFFRKNVQIQEYIFPIQKEKQELIDFQQQLNYFEDIKYLSELYSSNRKKSTNLIEDNNFIDEILRQFELLFNNAEYFQSFDILKNTKQTIQDLMDNNVIELPPLLVTKNEQKTPSLNQICKNHKKEIIMIDIDSQNKKIEDRFACVDCIAETSQIKYQTIENVNKQWKDYKQESEMMLQEYKKESEEKKSDLLNQIAQMRKIITKNQMKLVKNQCRIILTNQKKQRIKLKKKHFDLSFRR